MEITLAKGGRLPPTTHRPAAGAKLTCFVPVSGFFTAGATGRWAAASLRWGKGLQIRRCGPTGGLANSGAGDLYVCIEEQGLSTLELLSEMQPPAHLVERVEELKGNMVDVVAMAKAGHQTDKMGCAMGLLRGAYGIAELSHACYPAPGLPPLPDEQAFLSLCLRADTPPSPMMLGGLGPEVVTADAKLMAAVILAVKMATSATRTARYVYIHGCRGAGDVTTTP